MVKSRLALVWVALIVLVSCVQNVEHVIQQEMPQMNTLLGKTAYHEVISNTGELVTSGTLSNITDGNLSTYYQTSGRNAGNVVYKCRYYIETDREYVDKLYVRLASGSYYFSSFLGPINAKDGDGKWTINVYNVDNEIIKTTSGSGNSTITIDINATPKRVEVVFDCARTLDGSYANYQYTECLTRIFEMYTDGTNLLTGSALRMYDGKDTREFLSDSLGAVKAIQGIGIPIAIGTESKHGKTKIKTNDGLKYIYTARV